MLNPDFMSQYKSDVPPMPGLDVKNRSRGLDTRVGGGNPPVVGGALSMDEANGGVPGSSASNADNAFGSATAGLSTSATPGDETDAGIPGYQAPTPGSFADKASTAFGKAYSAVPDIMGMAVGPLGYAAGTLAQQAAHNQNPDRVGKPTMGLFGFALDKLGQLAQTLGIPGFDLGPAVGGEALGGLGSLGGVAGVAGVSGFGSEGSYGEGYGGGYGGGYGSDPSNGDMGAQSPGGLGAGDGSESEGGSTW